MGANATLRPFLAAALLALAGSALGQQFPSKPVRVVVAFSPGGVTDVMARTVAGKLAELWGQPVVVENRPGAGGSIATVAVARAPADGYMLLVVSPASGIRSVQDLIAAAKAKPGAVAYGSAGIGSGAHLNGEKFRIAASLDVLHVPYKGGAEAIHDTIAQRLGFTFNTITLALPHIREGRLRPLGVSSAQRSTLLPDVPTIGESGVPGFEFTFWSGLWAPAGTPPALVERIGRDVIRAIAQPDVRERFANLGAEPVEMTPAQFARFVRSETEDVARIGKAAGIKLQ